MKKINAVLLLVGLLVTTGASAEESKVKPVAPTLKSVKYLCVETEQSIVSLQNADDKTTADFVASNNKDVLIESVKRIENLLGKRIDTWYKLGCASILYPSRK